MIDEVPVLRIDTIVGESGEGSSAAIDDALRKAEERFTGIWTLEVAEIIVRYRKGVRSFEEACRVVFATPC